MAANKLIIGNPLGQVSFINIEGLNPQVLTHVIANSGTAIPIVNALEILGSYVSAGSIPVQTVASGNTVTTQVQISQATAAADVLKIGLSSFDSSVFSVSPTGFVSLIASEFLTTLQGNTGSPIPPVANNIFTVGSGNISISGSGNTLTTKLINLNAHAVQVGAGTDTLTQLAVGTNGQVLLGSTLSDPAFGTLTSIGSSILYTTGAHALNLDLAPTQQFTQVGIGNAPVATSPLSVTSTDINCILAQGTSVSVSSGTQSSIRSNVIFNPTAGSTLSAAFLSKPTFISPTANTITTAACFVADPVLSSNVATITSSIGLYYTGGSTGAGTITNAFGVYCAAPLHGTNKYTAYFESGVGINALNTGASFDLIVGNGILVSAGDAKVPGGAFYCLQNTTGGVANGATSGQLSSSVFAQDGQHFLLSCAGNGAANVQSLYHVCKVAGQSAVATSIISSGCNFELIGASFDHFAIHNTAGGSITFDWTILRIR